MKVLIGLGIVGSMITLAVYGFTGLLLYFGAVTLLLMFRTIRYALLIGVISAAIAAVVYGMTVDGWSQVIPTVIVVAVAAIGAWPKKNSAVTKGETDGEINDRGTESLTDEHVCAAWTPISD